MTSAEAKLLSESAHEFFTIGNAIAAFCIVQTLAFLLSFSRDAKLVMTLQRWRPFSTAMTVFCGLGYTLAVCVTFVGELWLRWAAEQSANLIGPSVLAFAVRVAAVILISLFYTRIFVEICLEDAHYNDPPQLKSLPSEPPGWIRGLDDYIFGARIEEIRSKQEKDASSTLNRNA